MFCFSLLLSAPFGGRLLNLTVVFLTLPEAVYEYPTAFSPDHISLRLPELRKRFLSVYSLWLSQTVFSLADCLLWLCNTRVLTETPDF